MKQRFATKWMKEFMAVARMPPKRGTPAQVWASEGLLEREPFWERARAWVRGERFQAPTYQ